MRWYRKQVFCIIVWGLGVFAAQAQDSVKYRVIYIGDAGEIDDPQKTVIKHATGQILPGKTTAVYLGDNIYPAGMGLPGSTEESETQKILSSQFEPFRQNHCPVIFVPGNHDWDHMNELGLAKIKAQDNFLKSYKDTGLTLLPHNGCPGPEEVLLTDNLVLIIYDSEWWVFTKNKDNPDGHCACNTEAQVVARMQALMQKHRHRTILLTNHHPFKTYGPHGSRFTFKDHIFPLVNIRKIWYNWIPLPVIGSLYPLLRSRVFINPEDVRHKLYRNMIRKVDGVFGKHPNVVHVSGHEHGLQFIKIRDFYQVVSGAGAKRTNAYKGKGSLFAVSLQGYVVADQLTDNSVRFTYYYDQLGEVVQGFVYRKPFMKQKSE
jgi:hypothetical protein